MKPSVTLEFSIAWMLEILSFQIDLKHPISNHPRTPVLKSGEIIPIFEMNYEGEFLHE
jgi:hypothetical protein